MVGDSESQALGLWNGDEATDSLVAKDIDLAESTKLNLASD